MAITDKEQGVWNLDEVYNKINQGSIWEYTGIRNFFTWGDNNDGQLAINLPNNNDRSSPVQVSGNTWASHYKGNMSNMATKTDGTLWSWGDNYNGQGALNLNSPNYSSPMQIGADTTWSTNVNGKISSMTNYGWSAIKSDGTLWSWGGNYNGFLGLNQAGGSMAANAHSSPTQVGTETTWAILADGGPYQENGGVKTDGTIWIWGRNANGTSGQNSTSVAAYSSPVQVGTDTTWSTDAHKFVIAAYGSCQAIKTDGSLWTWGGNGYGGLGLNQGNTLKLSSPAQIPGTYKCVGGRWFQRNAIKTDGTLWSWGYNLKGSLGHNNKTNYSSPKQVGTDTSWSYCQCFDYGNGTGGMLAVKNDGTFWTWGNNENGELGHNNTTDYSSPKQVPGTAWTGSTLTSAMQHNSCLQIQ